MSKTLRTLVVLAGLLLPVMAQAQGGWEVQRFVDPMDDSVAVVARLVATEGVGGVSSQPIVLVVRCQSNTTDAYVIWHEALAGASSRNALRSLLHYEPQYLEYRFPPDTSEKWWWALSTEREETHFPREDLDARFKKKLNVIRKDLDPGHGPTIKQRLEGLHKDLDAQAPEGLREDLEALLTDLDAGLDATIKRRLGTLLDRLEALPPQSGTTTMKFLRLMADRDRFVIRTTTLHRPSPITAIFDLDGAGEVISKVADACGWTL